MRFFNKISRKTTEATNKIAREAKLKMKISDNKCKIKDLYEAIGKISYESHIREKGTNRCQFIRGEVDKYTWHEIGSSYLPSDILAALLYGQLTRANEIMEKRMNIWNYYNEEFKELEEQGKLIRPYIPEYAKHNAHMYYIILPTEQKRNELIAKLKENGVSAVFHYIPLHTSPMGEKLGCKKGDLPVTEEYAGRLLRLPLYADMTEADRNYVVSKVKELLR